MQYSALFSHRLIVRDSTRTEAFRRAIEACVRPGDVVLDVGAGSGILSLFAARAGARRVYAVEQTPVARLARRLAHLNGAADVIHVMEAPIEAVSLPEQVDVLVSEWLGSIGVDENLLAPVLLARDRWLKPGGALVPSRVTAWAAPAHVPIRPDVAFFRARPYGLDLTPLAEPSLHELLCYRRRIVPGNLVASPQKMWTSRVAGVGAEHAALPARASLKFAIPQRAAVNCLVAWFSAELAPGISLTNAPGAPDTHWGQLLLPLEREQHVEPGDAVSVRIVCIPAGPERAHIAWSARIGVGRWEHHDTRVFAQRNGGMGNGALPPGSLPGHRSSPGAAPRIATGGNTHHGGRTPTLSRSPIGGPTAP